jgi:biopolymer transport protein ExbD
MKIVLPESRTGQPLPEDTSSRVRIELDASGEIIVRGRHVPLSQLVSVLKAVPVTRDTDLLVSADERTPHGKVVGVMDAAREAGALKVGIETYKIESGLRRPDGGASGPQ